MPRISIVRDDGVILSNIEVPLDSIRQLSISGDSNGEPVVQTLDVDLNFNREGRERTPRTLDEVEAELRTEMMNPLLRGSQGWAAGLGATMMFMPNRATSSYYRAQSEAERILQLPDPIEEMEEMVKQFDIMLRAEKLLKDVLGKEEYDKYKKRGFVPIPSKIHPGREYQVVPYGRVRVFEKGKKVMELCINPVLTDLPEQDTIVTKKLSLEADEANFLKTAIPWNILPNYDNVDSLVPRNRLLSRLYNLLERAE